MVFKASVSGAVPGTTEAAQDHSCYNGRRGNERSFQQMAGAPPPYCGALAPQRLLTYAIKDTVSVLYWYEKLSRNGKFFEKIFESFFCPFFFSFVLPALIWPFFPPTPTGSMSTKVCLLSVADGQGMKNKFAERPYKATRGFGF